MPLAVMLASISSNLAAQQYARVYVLQRELPAALRRKIERSIDPKKMQIRWITIGRSRLKSLRTTLRSFDTVSLESYYRLLLPSVLPDDLDRVIYLDSDLVVIGDLSKLWSISVQSTALLAVPELAAASKFVSSSAGVSLYRELSLPPQLKFFNSGVMLVNLENWRREHIALRALIYLDVARDHLRWHDQEALNVVVAGEWRELDPRWNVTMHLFRSQGRSACSREAAERPHIVHFNSAVKPWQPGFSFAFRDEFFRYLDQTAWSGWRPGDPPRLAIRVRNRLHRAAQKRYCAMSSKARVWTAKYRNWRLLRRRYSPIAEIGIPSADRHEVRAFVNVVEPLPELRELMEYYDELGVDRVFLLVVEAHVSEARRLVRNRVNLHVVVKPNDSDFSTHLTLRALLGQHARQCWSVILDSNERLNYPNEKTTSLRDLCRQLDASSLTAIVSPVICLTPVSPMALAKQTRLEKKATRSNDFVEIDTVASDPLTRRIFPARLLLDAHRDDRGDHVPYRSKVALFRFSHGMSIADGFRAVSGTRAADSSTALREPQGRFRVSVLRCVVPKV